ncbi:hypothetical protein I3760_11G011900 [Carya illinoinensis]|nr:hypothetical protein I3760_11G011900 [Carya illinoinensis]
MLPVSEYVLLKSGEKRNLHSSVDYLSELPQEIIVFILSLLKIKEAGRTSVLSSRWRYLWRYMCGLDFDESKLMSQIRWRKVRIECMKAERRRFFRLVKHVTEMHQSQTIDEFKVGFEVYEPHFKSEIESWINFSMKKKVKRLTLDFERAGDGYTRTRGNYTLTTRFLDRYSIHSLTSLCLTAVEVTGLVLDHILSKCPFLEVLHVEVSQSLVNLKVAGPSLKLKRLEILRCKCLENLEISAMNLVSFKYSGPEITKMALKHVPKLIDLSLACHYACFFVKHSSQFSSCLSKLKTLELDLGVEKFFRFPRFPELTNLRQLKLRVNARDVETLLHCTSLLKASPFLEKFSMQLLFSNGAATGKMKVRKAKHPHQCLKVVEMTGFIGCTVDMELSLYVLNNAACLEKLVIDTRYSLEEEIRWLNRWCAERLQDMILCPELDERIRDTGEKSAAIACARQLEARLPPGVELVIL